MTSTHLRNQIVAGEKVFGTLIVSPSPRWPEAVRGCGLDFVFIDTEHIAIDRADLSWMCQTYAALGLPPIVRIPSPDPYTATMALDAGAAGIV
ncbi:MAG: aldolase, partial [Opitutales bacterium]|nr:aldolase [Opitutales bacterium]